MEHGYPDLGPEDELGYDPEDDRRVQKIRERARGRRGRGYFRTAAYVALLFGAIIGFRWCTSPKSAAPEWIMLSNKEPAFIYTDQTGRRQRLKVSETDWVVNQITEGKPAPVVGNVIGLSNLIIEAHYDGFANDKQDPFEPALRLYITDVPYRDASTIKERLGKDPNQKCKTALRFTKDIRDIGKMEIDYRGRFTGVELSYPKTQVSDFPLRRIIDRKCDQKSYGRPWYRWLF